MAQPLLFSKRGITSSAAGPITVKTPSGQTVSINPGETYAYTPQDLALLNQQGAAGGGGVLSNLADTVGGMLEPAAKGFSGALLGSGIGALAEGGFAAVGEGGVAAGGTAAGGLEAGASPFLSGLDAGAIAGTDFAGTSAASGAAAGGTMAASIPGIDTIPTGDFVDNWDMLPNPDVAYQPPDALNMPLPNDGLVTGGMGGGAGLWDFLSKGGGLLSSLGINSGSILGQGADLAARTGPGLLALGYADRQPGLDVSGLKNIQGQLGGNQDAVIRAATDPFQMNIAAGYGDLLQSQGLRGIRGSSFGTTDIGNYLATTGRSLADAGSSAAQGSLALQGNLASNIAQLQNQAQQIKNSLYGRAFDVLGRGLNPPAGMAAPGAAGGAYRTSGTADLANVGSLLGGVGTLAKAFPAIGSAFA